MQYSERGKRLPISLIDREPVGVPSTASFFIVPRRGVDGFMDEAAGEDLNVSQATLRDLRRPMLKLAAPITWTSNSSPIKRD